MNIVWPVTALYSGMIGLWTYFKIGRAPAHEKMHGHHHEKKEMTNGQHKKLSWQQVTKGTLHCGSGCTAGDIVAELILLVLPITIFGSELAGRWTTDYVFAFLFGILFQYYAIKPMRDLSPRKALGAALKADALSLTSWQIGMYGWMAICIFLVFRHPLSPGDPVFWFMMQIAMLIGFITAYPVNWWLMKKGIKEAM